MKSTGGQTSPVVNINFQVNKKWEIKHRASGKLQGGETSYTYNVFTQL